MNERRHRLARRIPAGLVILVVGAMLANSTTPVHAVQLISRPATTPPTGEEGFTAAQAQQMVILGAVAGAVRGGWTGGVVGWPVGAVAEAIAGAALGAVVGYAVYVASYFYGGSHEGNELTRGHGPAVPANVID